MTLLRGCPGTLRRARNLNPPLPRNPSSRHRRRTAHARGPRSPPDPVTIASRNTSGRPLGHHAETGPLRHRQPRRADSHALSDMEVSKALEGIRSAFGPFRLLLRSRVAGPLRVLQYLRRAGVCEAARSSSRRFPPVESCTDAAVTMTARTGPSVSVATWRLHSSILVPPGYFPVRRRARHRRAARLPPPAHPPPGLCAADFDAVRPAVAPQTHRAAVPDRAEVLARRTRDQVRLPVARHVEQPQRWSAYGSGWDRPTSRSRS